MMDKINNMFSFFIFFIIVIVVLSLIAILSTKKYNDKKVKLYALFLDVNKRETLLFCTCLLNIILCAYLVINVRVYNDFCAYLIIINSFLFMVLSFRPRLMTIEIFYASSLVLMVKLLYLVDSYLTNIYYSDIIVFLKYVFMALIIVYSIFINIRKFELILNNNKYVRRNA